MSPLYKLPRLYRSRVPFYSGVFKPHLFTSPGFEPRTLESQVPLLTRVATVAGDLL